MTTITDSAATTLEATPSYEGANIRTWIGFKHFMYLVEAAVLKHFRDNGLGARELYHRHGVGLEVVDSSVQLPHVLEVDDDLEVVVEPTPRQKPGHGASFTARIRIRKGDDKVLALKGKVRVALIAEKDAPSSEPAPPAVSDLVLDEVAALADADEAGSALPVPDGQDVADVLVPPGSGAYLWSWRAPYFYCHYSDRVQHSAYVRAMEEVVDHFLHDRGLGIGRMLDERAWIPVVSRARVRLTADAHMEEVVHTVFTVRDFIKDLSYTATFDCYVRRADRLVRTATGTIMHGYAISRGEKAGTVAPLDEVTRKALLGDRA